MTQQEINDALTKYVDEKQAYYGYIVAAVRNCMAKNRDNDIPLSWKDASLCSSNDDECIKNDAEYLVICQVSNMTEADMEPETHIEVQLLSYNKELDRWEGFNGPWYKEYKVLYWIAIKDILR